MKIHFIHKILHIAIVLALLYACQTDEIINHGNEIDGIKINLSGEINQVEKTRVNDDGFCDKDEIGIYIVDYEGSKPGKLQLNDNRATNLKHTFDESAYKWIPAYDVYWKDNKTPVDIYGYYPLDNPESIETYAFEVQKDQSKEAVNGIMGGYEASDFLWGKAPEVTPTEQVIKITFQHKMSSARITLVEGEGFTDGEWTNLSKQVVISNTKRNASINLATGSVTATGEASTTGIIPYKKSDEFRAIIVPQTIKAGTKLFNITVGTVPYTFSKTEDFTYAPSKMHNFSIKVDKKAHDGTYVFTLISESITAWENDPISHNATAKEYIVIESKAGQLKECITAAKKDFRKIQNLKITGDINATDFYFMRDSMKKLQALNLKEVRIKASTNGNSGKNNQIPYMAFNQKESLVYLTLPDKLESIGTHAFWGCKSLSGSLIIPEGVTDILDGAFSFCHALSGRLSLPSTLKRLEFGAFYKCGFICELIIPDGVEIIGGECFYGCEGLYGGLKLPNKLKELGSRSFQFCSNLSGSLIIPQEINHIPEYSFAGCGFNGTLTLHDGITNIGEMAFSNCKFKGELILPQKLANIKPYAFEYCQFSGELKLPNTLISIGNGAFMHNEHLTGTFDIPDNVQSIGSTAFSDCSGFEEIIFPASLESIGTSAFSNNYRINRIICKGLMPPYVLSGAFSGISKENFTVEVPETAIELYQTAIGWNEFKHINAHHELECRPAISNAINTQCSRKLQLHAAGNWEVTNIPDWCTLSAMHGIGKAELTLTIHSMPQGSSTRTGNIVFALKDKDYTTRCHITQYNYEYNEDEIITLQSHTKGQGINLVFLGDGYDAKEISEGRYLQDIKEQVEHFFDIEPYNTYRDYFNVYTAIAVSPENGITTTNTIRHTKFETIYSGLAGLKGDYNKIFNYTLRIPTLNKNNLNQSLIIITPNTTDYEGICHIWDDGSAIAYCPKSTYAYPLDTRGVIQHEAGGHGFGKLADENIVSNSFISNKESADINWKQSLGWYPNISLTGKIHEVPWAHLIFDKRYSSHVDIFEGGYSYSRGVFRSEPNSCMNNKIPYYNTISRETIVKRIMEYAGEPYSFEEFVKNDKMNQTINTRSSENCSQINIKTNNHAPIIHKGKPDILKL